MQTLTLEQTRIQVDESRQQSFERFEKNKIFEEKTDIGERLGYHIDTTLHYEMKDGAAYCLSDTKHRAFHEQTAQAVQTGRWKFTGPNTFEYERLLLEHEEALLVDVFGRGELGGNVLIKFSKVPDAVVSGSATVDGYRRDLLRSFVRIYYRDNDGVHCKLFSLDGNDPDGFKAIDSVLGTEVSGKGSEEALGLSRSFFVDSDRLEEVIFLLAEDTKAAYDRAIRTKTGKKTYAGSEFIDMANALQVIDANHDLFDEHYRAIQDVAVRALSSDDKEQFLEHMRRKTAAAIKLRSIGASVDSIGDSSVAQEADNGEYGRECATSGMDQAQQAEVAGKEITMTCPFCGLATVGDPCATQIICTKCSAEVYGGRVVSRGIGRKAALERLVQAANVQPQEAKPGRFAYSESRFAEKFGKRAIIRATIGLGEAKKNVVDRVTGEVLHYDVKKSDLVEK